MEDAENSTRQGMCSRVVNRKKQSAVLEGLYLHKNRMFYPENERYAISMPERGRHRSSDIAKNAHHAFHVLIFTLHPLTLEKEVL